MLQNCYHSRDPTLFDPGTAAGCVSCSSCHQAAIEDSIACIVSLTARPRQMQAKTWLEGGLAWQYLTWLGRSTWCPACTLCPNMRYAAICTSTACTISGRPWHCDPAGTGWPLPGWPWGILGGTATLEMRCISPAQVLPAASFHPDL